uniref:HAT C-terminal dimerisation domain-containing protein n=1 Tax=Cajanus cajan TaxID=3821 RepID=A0A151SQM6_CAJCA|nr:hypothetical protein KK1_003322 [Cajanus cajan]
MLKKFTKGRDLVRPDMTRFASAYLTLSCLNDNKASLMSMFSSNEWKSSKFSSTPEGRKVQGMALDSRLWKDIIICLKVVVPLMTVLCLVDSDEKPAMDFIYDGMDCAKEKIKINFNNVNKSYEPIWNIIDERWELKKFAICVLSLTCSSSGCERNWSSFEMVIELIRNRLHQRKMNDLVYVMYNLKLKSKQVKRILLFLLMNFIIMMSG